MTTEVAILTCKWCGQQSQGELPSEEPFRSFMINMADKMGCDRCTDFQKKQHQRYEVIQKLVLPLSNRVRPSDDMVKKIKEHVRRIFGAVVADAERFYQEPLQQHFEESLKTILENPRNARAWCQEFDKGLRLTSKR